MRTLTRRVGTILAVLGMLGTAFSGAAQADWVPGEVPEAVRFTIVGYIAHDYYEREYDGVLLVDITSASPSAQPFVTDGDALVTDHAWQFAFNNSDTDFYDLGVLARAYGWMIPDDSAPDGARFVADRMEPGTTPEATPLTAGPYVEAVTDYADNIVGARKSTLVWTGGPESCSYEGEVCTGVVAAGDFAGSTLELTWSCIVEQGWPVPLTETEYVSGTLTLSDGTGGELAIALSAERPGPVTFATGVSATVTSATGSYDGIDATGALNYPDIGCGWPGVGPFGASVGELLLW